MAEQATRALKALPLALAEPDQRVSGGWITGLGLASLVMWMAALTPLQVLLPEQLQAIDPAHKFLALGLVNAVGAVAAVVATPLVGALSDRTSHLHGLGRMRGRRHRWTLAMALLGAVSLVLIGVQSTVLGVAVLWTLFSIFQNGEYASLSAAIPDHVPVGQRATVAGWVGMPQAVGLVIGTVLVVDVFAGNSKSATGLLPGYLALAIPLLALALPFVLLTRDHPLDPEDRSGLSLRELLSSYWVDLRQYPDFGWAWLTRLLAALAIAMGTLYLLYFLQHIKYPHPAKGLLLLIVIYTVFVVVTAVVGGMISDRLGKRKMIVTISGILMGLAAVLLTFVETWQAAEIAAVLFGAGFGAYLAVDQALITQVLPAAKNRAKDLGIINIAIAGPPALAGFISPALVTLGGYPLLFGGTAVVAVIGSVLVWRIKSVP